MTEEVVAVRKKVDVKIASITALIKDCDVGLGDEVEASYYPPDAGKDSMWNLTRQTATRLIEFFDAKEGYYKQMAGSPERTVDVILGGKKGKGGGDGPQIRFTLEAPFEGEAIPMTSSSPLGVKVKSVISKVRSDRVDVPEYRVRVNRKSEMVIKEYAQHAGQASRALGTSDTRIYRYKKRWSYFDADDKDFTITVTTVRQLLQTQQGSLPATYGEIFKAPETYEVEVEYVGKKKLEGEHAKVVATAMMRCYMNILKVIDETAHPMPLEEHKEALAEYKQIVRGTEFIGPKPVTLELANLECIEGGVPCILRDYTVTEKADGERRLLFVGGKGRIYTVDERMMFRDTGRVTKQTKMCLLDGEHVECKPGSACEFKFLVFDAMFKDNVDVRKYPLKASSGSNRLSFAREVVGDVVDDRNSTYYGIDVKEFMDVRSVSDMAVACGRIFHKIENGKYPYGIDGMIWTDAASRMPVSSVRWNTTMKWKPSDQNTIDFQVCLRPEDELVVINNVKHRVADLKVGGDLRFSTKLTAMEMIAGNPERRITGEPNYGGVDFRPRVPFDGSIGSVGSPAHVCYLPVSKDNQLKCKGSQDVIVDKAIVEFSFDAEDKAMSLPQRWIPKKVRWDKMAAEIATRQFKANNEATAESVWRTILHPVTKKMLMDRTGESVKEGIKRMKTAHADGSSYYVTKMKSDEGGSGGMRSFHNYWVKKESLLMHFSSDKGDALGRSIFDIGCGRGGDLYKWIDMKATKVLGVDKYANNMYDPDWSEDRAYVRLLKARGVAPKGAPKGDNPFDANKIKFAKSMRVVFLPMDVSEKIEENYINALDRESGDRAVARCLWKIEPAGSVPKSLQEYYGFAEMFDLVTCMFAIHYFFEKEESLGNFCSNVASVLRNGGHFVGCCLDGDAVDKLLNANAKKIGEFVGQGSVESPTWKITRQYDAMKGPKGSKLGRRIDVFVESIGQEVPEYLVDYGDLVAAMKKVDIVPVTAQEATALGLFGNAATGMFEDLFKGMQSHVANAGGHKHIHKKVTEALHMSDGEKRYSFLHRWFVFKKVGKTV